MTVCKLCSSTLTPQARVPGSDGRSYLLTRAGLFSVTVCIRSCTNSRCSARYSYNNWKDGSVKCMMVKINIKCLNVHSTGIFNVCNKLMVSIDILFDMRHHIQRGEPPGNCTKSILESILAMCTYTAKAVSGAKAL